MNFDDKTQEMVWIDRKECEGKNHPEIIDLLVARAEEQGKFPMDLNWSGTPNIYLRGRYRRPFGAEPSLNDPWEADGFVMFVQRTGKFA